MEGEDEPFNEIGVDDHLIERHGINFAWGVGNQMMVVAGRGKSDHGISRLSSSHPILMHEVQWNVDLHSEISRKLVNETHQIFLEVQKSKKDTSEGSHGNSSMIKFSRRYRAVLRACVLELKSKLESGSVEDTEVEQQMQVFRIMEIIWNLCEILFIENSPAGVILLRLVEWCRWHFTLADDLTSECTRAEYPHLHPSYWNAVKCLVLQGRTEDARNMLKLHPDFQTQVYDAYSSIDELLRKMPLFSYYQGQSVMEFEMKWNHWQEECHRRLGGGEFDATEDIREICLILCGDEEVFEILHDLHGSWYQALVSFLLYTQPAVGMIELQHHSKISIEMFGGREKLGAFDHILIAAYDLDPYQVIKKCSQHLSNWWLAAHLADVFHYCGLMSQKKLGFGINLREFLLLEYASSLISHDSLWRINVDYLSACSSAGRHYLSLFVQRIPLTSEKKASKLLRLCQERGLYTEAQSTCRQMSISSLKSNRLGTTLIWCLRSNDSSLTMCVAEKMLLEYRRTGKFVHVDLLDYLGPSILLSERLTFLGKYKDFHRILAEGSPKDAGALLLNLLVSRIAPQEFWAPMLLDSLPLLECDDLVFGTEDSVKLLTCLNSLDLLDIKDPDLTTKEEENQHKNLEVLRLALARNLAKAIITVEV